MNRQSGVIAPAYIWLVGTVIVLFLVWQVEKQVTAYLDRITTEAKKAGQDECDAAYVKRDNVALVAALARVKQLEDAARTLEGEHTLALAAIGSKLKQEQANGKAAALRVLDDIAAGKYRVRADAFQATGCPATSDPSQIRTAIPAAPGSDGRASCQLSESARSALFFIGQDADDVANQLAAAQAVIRENLRICGPGT